MRKSIEDMKPAEIVSLIRERIRKHLGDETENVSLVFSAAGRYYVTVPDYFDGDTFALRRWQIPAFLKELKAAKG